MIFHLQSIGTVAVVVLVAFLACWLVQALFLLIFYRRLAWPRQFSDVVSGSPVSVIIPFRNAEAAVPDLIRRILKQEHAGFEVVAVDDCSQDTGLLLVGMLAKADPRVRFTSMSQENRFSEKMAINIGLKAAANEWAVFIKPHIGQLSNRWLPAFSAAVDERVQFVVMYAGVEPQPGAKAYWYRLERFCQFFVSGAFCAGGMPFVYHDENVVFRKSAYFESDGFRHKMNKHFANLELVFNEKMNRRNTRVVLSPHSAVGELVDIDHSRLAELIKKSLLIRKSLPFFKRALVWLDEATRLGLLTAGVAGLIVATEWYFLTGSLLLVYFLLLLFIVKKAQLRLNERKILLSSLGFILFRPLIGIYWSWRLLINKQRNKWK